MGSSESKIKELEKKFEYLEKVNEASDNKLKQLQHEIQSLKSQKNRTIINFENFTLFNFNFNFNLFGKK